MKKNYRTYIAPVIKSTLVRSSSVFAASIGGTDIGYGPGGFIDIGDEVTDPDD